MGLSSLPTTLRKLLVAALIGTGIGCVPFQTNCSEADALCDGFRVWLAYQSITPLIVVGDNNGVVHLSADGINWQSTTIDAGGDISDLTWTNGAFRVTVDTNTPARTAFSADGLNWQNTANGLAMASQLSGIAFGNGRYVVVGDNGSGNGMHYSNDGVNWVASNDGDLVGVSFGGIDQLSFLDNQFVAGDSGAGVVYISADGIDWSQGFTLSDPEHFGKVGSYFFCTDSNQLYAKTEITGAPPPTVPGLVGIQTAASNLFGFGIAAGTGAVIHTTTDGINWTTNRNPGGGAQLTAVTIEDPRLMLAGGTGGAYYLSTSGGASWEGPYTLPGAGDLLSAVTRPGFPFQ